MQRKAQVSDVPYGSKTGCTSSSTGSAPLGIEERRRATQFFESLFDVAPRPGETFQYTFTTPGEYFFNDGRPAGKVEVYPR